MTKAIDFVPSQKTWVKGWAVRTGKSFLTAQKKSPIDALKTVSKRANQKVADTGGDLAEYKVSQKIIKTTSKSTGEDPSKQLMQIDESLLQPIQIPKKVHIAKETTTSYVMNFDYYNYKYIQQEWSIRKS